ncbi:GNAT family N-acetyltransferase [Pseudooceanicola sp. C21-150M6]|uniref:GNAT family N-acetyltransferase n=1 Tax=Pseudooceanicola sp. C21-150M6 TaxID=3434355 RepID=UPI003D7F1CD5
MDMTFRQAATADIGPIVRLWEAAWHDAHGALVPSEVLRHRTPESFVERTRKHLDGFRLLLDGAALMGFHLCLDDEISQFYLAPQARGTGAAARLMTDAEAVLAARGYRDIWLACAEGNDRARRFYEKTGFRCARTTEMPLGTEQDPAPIRIWRMEKRLS